MCAGDTAVPAPRERLRILRYGTSARFGRIVCVSRKVGLTCRNRGGRGFFLSVERIRVF